MSKATILNGKALSEKIIDHLHEEIQKSGITPCLATVIVGQDPASQMYVRMKHTACEQVGIESEGIICSATISEAELRNIIQRLNKDPEIHGILIQLPLPKHINTGHILQAVTPEKDVDGFHPINLGLLLENEPGGLRPCTPQGIMTLLAEYEIDPAGKHAVVIGRSTDVGKPIAALLLNADATVTICHSKTEDLISYTKKADIIVSAAGRPHMVTADMVKPGCIVIDVGINHIDGKLCGDVDFEEVAEIAAAITPVPGGVGPMTIATLMENTYKAALNISCRHV
ncbi:MAG: bifunctional methylenetetrahydrofolate dehydrogenase/methenyltetrahydrofolate cyclohydrolase FolD [Methanomicrobiales archaeon]|jgi:methylenetetrahydrofolate dehydrogenase (NADP+)/methenyltetrahydrofolate cyclohydrolase|nr:bifunctional methylenetetrahydrofolate dehydrogenase/methenyltetrahydrofolate cyclohydrolase FolD [Methanomicrobiales archaeon]